MFSGLRREPVMQSGGGPIIAITRFLIYVLHAKITAPLDAFYLRPHVNARGIVSTSSEDPYVLKANH